MFWKEHRGPALRRSTCDSSVMVDLSQELTTAMKDWKAFQVQLVIFLSGKLMSFVRAWNNFCS